MKVRLTQAALTDLRTVARWIAQDRPNAAKRIAHDLRTACAALGDHPEAYPRIEAANSADIRRRPHGRHLIFYRIDPTDVVIIRILDGAQDIEALFGPPGG